MAVSATQIQLLRSDVANCRPDPAQLLPGQPAVNLYAGQPGLFFTDTNGVLFKVGPASVGAIPPNTTPAGNPGNSQGELWFNTQDQTLKVYVSGEWRDCDPSELGYSKVIIQTTPPDKDIYPNGALWWNDYNGEMYVLYDDPNGRQWVQVGAGGSGGGSGAVIVADQQPDPESTPVGTLWWNDNTGSLFILFNDGGPNKLWIQIAGAGAINAGQGGSVTKIDAGVGLGTANGQPITTQGTIFLKPATAATIGGVKPGNNVLVSSDGTISFNGPGSGTVTQIQTGPGLGGGPITTTGTITLSSATTNQIGGVKPGAGLAVTGGGALYIGPATNSSLGGVIVGQGLNVTPGGVVSVNAVPPGFIPAGTVQWFAGQTPPDGWLYCNGATLSTLTYPDLFAAIGRTYTPSTVSSNQFCLPDLRGQFLRGWDNRSTGGVDDGRAFGSFQNDAFASHFHDMIGAQDGWRNTMDALGGGGGPGLTSTGNVRFTDPKTENAGGTETRPKNVALLPIIRT